jgi:hypothetical protein
MWREKPLSMTFMWGVVAVQFGHMGMDIFLRHALAYTLTDGLIPR